MTQTHPPWTDSQEETEPSHTSARLIEGADPVADPPVSRAQHRTGLPMRGREFDSLVEEIRRRYYSNETFLFTRLEDLVRRRFGLRPMSRSSALLAGALGMGIRLAVAGIVTTLSGQWTVVPWGRWLIILGFFGVYDAMLMFNIPPLEGELVRKNQERWVGDYTALLPRIEREADLRDIADYVRRTLRLPVAVTVGGLVASGLLAACWVFAPTGMSGLPAGSIALLAFVLYDFGVMSVDPGSWGLIRRQARCDHHLFWASPVDTPEVQRAMRMTTIWGFASGMWVTIYLVLTLVLISWDSPLVTPLAVGFIALGYLTTLGWAVGGRAAIQQIVHRSRLRRLAALQDRLETFEPRLAELPSEEAEQAKHLIELHATVRDAPTTPGTANTVLRAATGLIVPTIVFIITVLGEVSAERILNAILP